MIVDILQSCLIARVGLLDCLEFCVEGGILFLI